MGNGTSAWGQSSRGCRGWGEGGHDSSGPYDRGNAPAGSGSCKEGNEIKNNKALYILNFILKH